MKPQSCLRFSALAVCLGLLATALPTSAQDAAVPSVENLEAALKSATQASSVARQRLGLRRVIRDAEKAVTESGDKPERWALLELLLRAQKLLVSMDDDKAHRDAVLVTCRELVKAPREFAGCRLEADLLLSQVEQVKNGADKGSRAAALRDFTGRYVGTPVEGRALRAAIVMAIEMGDDRLIADLCEMIAIHCSADCETIAFQRDQLGGRVFGAPFAGAFKSSDDKIVRLPMDVMGRSALILFWSKEGEGLDFARGMAEASKAMADAMLGRVEVISINLDDLPDAGESIVRGFGANWQCLHLPGGRENPVYKAYARQDPLFLRTSSTGQVALVMDGLQRPPEKKDGAIDHERILVASMAQPWTHADYCVQLTSLEAGDFLIFDPEGNLNPALPPELKAMAAAKAMERKGIGVPEETLLAIQGCIVAPATCYQSPPAEVLAGYRQAVELCRKAMSDHADASDLWLVRNRLIVALMGLWKLEADLARLEQAFDEAKQALDAGYPAGCDVVARFCLARQALRDEKADSAAIIEAFLREYGGEKASGPALAVASLLALDAAERALFERCKDLILEQHTDNPMMWLFVASLLDRHHDYWRFQVPFYVGRSYPQRETAFKERGESERAHRMLKGELLRTDGSVFRIPDDLTADYTAIFFTQPGPWDEKGLDGLPASPYRATTGFASYGAARPDGKVHTILAVLADKPLDAVAKDRRGADITHPFDMMALPGGAANPMAHRLGLLFDQGGLNSVLVDRQGRILCMISGIARPSTISENALRNVLHHQDELAVDAMLAEGQIDEAKKFILSFAPDQDPSKYPSEHLRARARVYNELGESDKALADVKMIIERHQHVSDRTSERTDQHVADEDFRDEIIGLKEAKQN